MKAADRRARKGRRHAKARPQGPFPTCAARSRLSSGPHSLESGGDDPSLGAQHVEGMDIGR